MPVCTARIRGAPAGAMSMLVLLGLNLTAISDSICQITVLVSISVSVAMYCLLQLYFPVSKLLAVHKPILKLLAVKAVGMYFVCCSKPHDLNNLMLALVFLTFWQATFLSFLTMFGVVKDVRHTSLYELFPLAHSSFRQSS